MSKITPEFRRSALRNGVVVRTGRTHDTSPALIHAAVIEMANLGFLVDAKGLSGMSATALDAMLGDARSVVGADRNMRPIYPGFPNQVKELSTATLLFEQILHYWSFGTLLPNYPDVAREGLPIADMVRNAREVKVLTSGEAARHFIETLTTKGIAMSDDERTLLDGSIALAVPSLEEAAQVISRARNGENIQALVLGMREFMDAVSASDFVKTLVPACSNLDQVLRVVLAVATTPVQGRTEDYDLAVKTLADRRASAVRMVNLSRPARRVVLAQVARLSTDFAADALVSRQQLWRRVMRMVHPYDFTLNAAAKRAADIIHSNVEHRTLNSLVEKGMADGDVTTVVGLLAEHQPGNLLRRIVALLRLSSSRTQVQALADAVREVGARSTITTLVSAYNGVISVNDKNARITRVAGLRNTLRETDARPVKASYVTMMAEAIKDALRAVLARKTAPVGKVGTGSDLPVPLVRRDLSTTDRVMDRGQTLTPAGEGDTVRMFSHWVNNQHTGGYIDIGAVVLDAEFKTITVNTWNSWMNARDWSTYSGDKHVYPGDDAAEYIDVDLPALRKKYRNAKWVAMTLQSWSGFQLDKVDLVAGTMLRSKPDSGEVFDARTVTTAFRPTTNSLQAVPLVVNVDTGEMIWLDSSNGSMERGISSAQDETIGVVVYDELARERMTLGDLATLWAEAHKVDTTSDPVDKDALLGLLD